MKKIILVIVILILVIVVGIGGFFIWQRSKKPSLSPSDTVDIYMRATLGTIGNAQVDYELAKNYLAPDLCQQFTDASFVPLSYCIQDGPSDVKIISEDISDNRATVKVSGQYGADWQTMWEFVLMIDTGEWKIEEINCLHLP